MLEALLKERTEAGLLSAAWARLVELDDEMGQIVALKVSRSITSEDVIDTLAELFAMRGVPECVRSD